jgi:BolA protein
MNREERIRSILTNSLSVRQLEVIDDSLKHKGHVGSRPSGETHYTIVIEADDLKGKSRVAQHQLIYKLLDSELKDGLHALAIKVI